VGGGGVVFWKGDEKMRPCAGGKEGDSSNSERGEKAL